jgi:hypothetical protein
MLWGYLLQPQFRYSQPRQREESVLRGESRLSELTASVCQQRATIDLGITPVLPNCSRIASLTSAGDKRGD